MFLSLHLQITCNNKPVLYVMAAYILMDREMTFVVGVGVVGVH
jgi:hypothetical protein